MPWKQVFASSAKLWHWAGLKARNNEQYQSQINHESDKRILADNYCAAGRPQNEWQNLTNLLISAFSYFSDLEHIVFLKYSHMYFSFQKHAFLSNFGKKEQNLTNQLISPQTSKTFSPNIKSPVKMKPQRKVMNKENSRCQGKYEGDTDR